MNGAAASIVAVDPAAAPDDAARRPAVSVVMVVYMTGAALGESLACVLQDDRVDEVVVVDNGSTAEDGLYLRQLAERDGRVVLMSGHGNVGFAKAANLGAKTAKGDVLLFLNPDAF